MPTIPQQVSESVAPGALRVLITGYGPFAGYTENPSWLAVRPLHNTVLYTQAPTSPVTHNGVDVLHQPPLTPNGKHNPQLIHITALEIPVTYADVLSSVPRLHARPPSLPKVVDSDKTTNPTTVFVPPPPEGYDFIFHIGAGYPGDIRVETLAHKSGYRSPDVDGKYAPIIEGAGEDKKAETEAQRKERERLGNGHGNGLLGKPPVRGFGEGYEPFGEEMHSILDVKQLVQDLKEGGFEPVRQSFDAGRYLCDFIFYCSLAEAERTAKSTGKNLTPVLFMHCPAVNTPLPTEQVTDAIKRVVAWVCANGVKDSQ